MGADGGISIWRADKVREVWPDADNLFDYIPTRYKHELDGVEYYHCYHGDNLEWNEPWWHMSEICPPDEMRERMKEFVAWLQANETHWEVWT